MPRIHPAIARPIRVGGLIGAVLVGGEGRRMGAGPPKPLRLLAGRPMLAHVVERLRPQVMDLVLSAHGDAGPWRGFDAPVVLDSLPPDADGRRPGPLAGVLAALDWTRRHHPAASWVLTVPADVPLLPADLTVYLAGHMHVPEADVLTVRFRGRTHHAIAVWRVELLEPLRRAVSEEGVRSIEAFTRRHELAILDWPRRASDPFLNVNTPGDLARAEALLR
ncbi:MAG: molybdenum cofactor guanylyltransferase [Reyranellaceae bacterium]